jgi:uncharacterized protein YrzB (UPF0473 family)
MQNKKTITLYNPQNEAESIVCHILLEFKSTITGKSYILFSPEDKMISKTQEVQACIIDRGYNPPKLTPISTDFEWEMIETILEDINSETATI